MGEGRATGTITGTIRAIQRCYGSLARWVPRVSLRNRVGCGAAKGCVLEAFILPGRLECCCSMLDGMFASRSLHS